MKTLVTGPEGFVGRRIMAQFPLAMPSPSLRDMGEEQIADLLEQTAPDVIIHTAAISDIPTCEANPEASFRANVEIPVWLAKHSGSAKLVAFSSDQVYSGCSQSGPYREEITCPANVYARHKLEMEEKVLAQDPDAVLLRAEWMYDYISPRGNYLLNLLNGTGSVAFSSGQFRGITYLREVAENMEAVIRLSGGSYNFGSETMQDMYTITRDFVQWLGLDRQVQDCPARHNLWMDCGKARSGGVEFSEVSDALRKCAADYHLK